MNKKKRDRLTKEINVSGVDPVFKKWLKNNPAWTPAKVLKQSRYWYTQALYSVPSWPISTRTLYKLDDKRLCEAVLIHRGVSKAVLDAIIEINTAAAVRWAFWAMTSDQIKRCLAIDLAAMVTWAPFLTPKRKLNKYALKNPAHALWRYPDQLYPKTLDKCAKLMPWYAHHYARRFLTPYRRRWCAHKVTNRRDR